MIEFKNHNIVRKNKYWDYDISKLAFNYRLSDLNCALGLSQIKKINFFLKKRKKIYDKYLTELENYNPNLIIPKYSDDIKPSYHLFLINIMFDKLKKNKDHFIKYLNDHNIMAQYHYIPIYKFKIFNKL